MKHQITKLYALSFCAGLVFYYGIERLYFFSLGYEASIIALLPIASAIVTIALDIPLGYFSDKIGRKRTLVLACISLALSSLLYVMSSSLLAIIMASSLHALFWVGVSGTFQALIFESLRDLGSTKHYNKILGRVYSFLFGGMGIAILSAGFIAEAFGFGTNFFLAMLSATVATFIALTLREPSVDKQKPLDTWVKHVKEAAHIVRYSRVVSLLLMTALVFGAVIWVSNEFSQYIFQDLGLQLQLVSILSALALFSASVGRLLAHRLEKLRRPLVAIMLLLIFGVGLAEPPLIYICLLLYFGIAHCFLNSIESAIQHKLPNHLRATTMSLYSTLLSIIILVFAPLSSLVLRYYEVQSLFVIAAIITSVSLGVLYYLLRLPANKVSHPR